MKEDLQTIIKDIDRKLEKISQRQLDLAKLVEIEISLILIRLDEQKKLLIK